MTANMERVYTHGKMVDSTMDAGTMENSTEKEFIDKPTVRREKDSGKRASA